MCFDDRVSGVLETVSGLLHRQETEAGKTRHANMYVLYVPDSPTSRRGPEGPSRTKPQIRNIYIERHPSNTPARPYPKGPTGYRLHSFLPSEGSFWSRFFGGIVLPTFRTDSSKRRNAPGGRRRARGWWRRCGRSWLLLRVRGCTTQHKRRNGRYKRTGRNGGALTFLAGSAHNPLKISVG